MKNVYKDLSMDFGLSCWVILKIDCLQNIDWELFEKNNFFHFLGVKNPPKVKISKLDKSPILFGTPCSIVSILN